MTRPEAPRISLPSSEPVVLPLDVPLRAQARRSPIETQRLALAPVDTQDSDDLWHAIDGSRWHLERWLPWVPFNNSPAASVRFAEACMLDWDAGRALRFTVRDKQTRELLGIVGLDNCVHLHRSAELGYWLKREVTGRGLMTEAARATADFGFQRIGLHRIRCAAATDNFPSLRVIARLGFRFEGIARNAELVGARWLDHAVFARLSTDD